MPELTAAGADAERQTVATPRPGEPRGPAGEGRDVGISLVAVLAVVVFIELLVERVGVRLVHDDMVLPRGSIRGGLDLAATYAFHFTSVLGVLLAALAFIKLMAQQPSVLVPQGGRAGTMGAFVVGITMLLFIVVATLGVATRLHGRLLLYMIAVFTYLVSVVAGAGVRNLPVAARVKLWLTLVLLAALAHAACIFVVEMQAEDRPRLAQQLLLVGEALAVTLAATAPFALWTQETQRKRALVVGALIAGGFFGRAESNHGLAARVVGYGFGVQLPSSQVGVALYAVAAGGLAAAVTGLLLQKGPPRLRAYGLLLLVGAGYQLELPYQLAASLVGLICVVDSFARVSTRLASGLSGSAWRELTRRLAADLGAQQVVSTGPEGYEATQIAVNRDGEALEVKMERRGGQVVWGELVVGRAPADQGPPLSLIRRGSAKLGARPREGLEVATGDKSFDDAIAVRDGRRLTGPDPILDDTLRPRLRASVDGWLGVWPGEGVRYRTASANFGRLVEDEAPGHLGLLELIDLLADVKRRR